MTPGSVNGITFHDITGSGMTDTRGCPISGTLTNGVTYRVKNILFDNVNISFAGGLSSIPSNPPEYAGEYPENTMWGNLPAYGYYIRHATNVTFTNCFTSAASADARPWIATNDVSNLHDHRPDVEYFTRHRQSGLAMEQRLHAADRHQRRGELYGFDRSHQSLYEYNFDFTSTIFPAAPVRKISL